MTFITKKLALEKEPLFRYLQAEYEREFIGWDFSELKEKIIEDPLSWDYQSIITSYFSQTHSMLDMGTGGGEFLSSLHPNLPPNTKATEGFENNIKIARSRLIPLGIEVSFIKDDSHLPYQDNYFDLIINRHESYNAQEIYRILKPGAFFITQQVGGKNELDLNRALGSTVGFDMEFWTLDYAVKELIDTGFSIDLQLEEFPFMHYKEIGALVYYLKAVPWQIPDFSVEKYYTSLKQVHQIIEKQGEFKVAAHRFLIVAKKPSIT
ncbi:class I SAM-dependent methyltransferase [Candidatus Harpocratesius sp.]